MEVQGAGESVLAFPSGRMRGEKGRIFPACKMHMDVSVCNSKFASQVTLAWT